MNQDTQPMENDNNTRITKQVIFGFLSVSLLSLLNTVFIYIIPGYAAVGFLCATPLLVIAFFTTGIVAIIGPPMSKLALALFIFSALIGMVAAYYWLNYIAIECAKYPLGCA